MRPFQVDAGIEGATALDPGELPIVVGYLVATAALLGSVRLARPPGSRASDAAEDPAPPVAPDSPRGRLSV
ncbi:MAG TPA: hypothetical protein VFZ32_22150 [Micromonosporaceae bacterium]